MTSQLTAPVHICQWRMGYNGHLGYNAQTTELDCPRCLWDTWMIQRLREVKTMTSQLTGPAHTCQYRMGYSAQTTELDCPRCIWDNWQADREKLRGLLARAVYHVKKRYWNHQALLLEQEIAAALAETRI